MKRLLKTMISRVARASMATAGVLLLCGAIMLTIAACTDVSTDDSDSTGSYTCSNGIATHGKPSNSQNVESCSQCDSGYILENNRCRTAKYTCAYGMAVDGSPNGNADVEKCSDCDTNFSLSDERCIISSITNVANVANVDDDDNINYELLGVAEVATAVVGDTTYLFATGFDDDGVSVFSVGTNGSLDNVFNVTDAGNLELHRAIAVTTAVVGGTTYLFVTGFFDDGVSVFSVGTNGSLDNVFNVTDAGNLELHRAIAVTTAVVGSTTYLFVAGGTDDGISVFSVGSDGTLTNVHNVTDTDDLALAGVDALTTAVVGNTTFLFATGLLDNGISVFSVANSGVLTNVHNVFDTDQLEIEMASSVATAVVGDTTYLFVSGSSNAMLNTGDNGVSVFSVGSDGTLTNVHNEPDTDNIALSKAVSVATTVVGTTSYLFVAGADDNGVSVFLVADGGILTHIGNITDTDVLNLAGARFVTTTVIGDTTHLFVVGAKESGISVFSIP